MERPDDAWAREPGHFAELAERDRVLSTEPREDHAQYIQSWLRVLKADKRAIFTAASKAQQAADWMAQAAESRMAAAA